MKNSLIYINKNSLPKDFCDHVIKSFEEAKDYHIQGVTTAGVDYSVKKSIDLMVNPLLEDENWMYIYSYIMENLLFNLVKYIEQYPFIFFDKFKKRSSLVRTIHKCLQSTSVNDDHHVQVQKYVPGGGFYRWHCENQGGDTIKRELAYMWYLNDIEEEGGTEFLMQNIKVDPSVGTNVIFPAYWTHAHRGVIAPNETKYIITGWITKQNNSMDFIYKHCSSEID